MEPRTENELEAAEVSRPTQAQLAGVRHVKIPKKARLAFSGQLFNLFQWEEPQFDGKITTFEMASRPDSVNIIAVDKDGNLLLTEQEQPGVPRPFYDFPGGRVDGDESAHHAACREMLEETGYVAKQISLIHIYQATDRVDALTHVYRAHDVCKRGDPRPDSGERIKPVWLPIHQVKKYALANHRLAIAPVLLAADAADLITRDWITEIPPSLQGHISQTGLPGYH